MNSQPKKTFTIPLSLRNRNEIIQPAKIIQKIPMVDAPINITKSVSQPKISFLSNELINKLSKLTSVTKHIKNRNFKAAELILGRPLTQEEIFESISDSFLQPATQTVPAPMPIPVSAPALIPVPSAPVQQISYEPASAPIPVPPSPSTEAKYETEKNRIDLNFLTLQSTDISSWHNAVDYNPKNLSLKELKNLHKKIDTLLKLRYKSNDIDAIIYKYKDIFKIFVNQIYRDGLHAEYEDEELFISIGLILQNRIENTMLELKQPKLQIGSGLSKNLLFDKLKSKLNVIIDKLIVSNETKDIEDMKSILNLMLQNYFITKGKRDHILKTIQ